MLPDGASQALEEQRAQLELERLSLEQRFTAENEKAVELMRQETSAKNDLIARLEQEKAKIEQDVQSLKEANEQRKRNRTDLQALAGPDGDDGLYLASDSQKSEFFKLSVMIKEANAISEGLKQHTVFRRGNDDGGQPRIKVNNTKLDIFTTWSKDKFENRL